MKSSLGQYFDSMVQRRALRRWRRAAEQAGQIDLGTLRAVRSQARALDRQLERLAHVADGRLALPMIGSNAMRKPASADWSWRPELWRGPMPARGLSAVESQTMFGAEATVFHDCATSELTLRQIRNTREADLAPFGLRLDVFRFDGSFLSLVLDLPQEAIHGLRRRHIVRMDTTVEMERPIEIFARLNVKHGPNTDQVVRELPLQQPEVMVEFDLGYTKINEKRIEKIWVDLIFETPEMNQITLRDLTFSRRPRAEV
ncbi:DUF6478 family protein [Acidimangrovimonas sediminis]|uniref:DUF6478 family protein n=1 Tax=Acidimangrovimonas sediminis TaxID=2056283 RepID=UPI0018EC9859|nr:DUF6478 family protein [Acidimangrovimonas sediminis]